MPHLKMRDGARLHYHDLGRKRAAKTCVLLHGFAMPSSLWLPFVTPHLHRARFILPSLRGFGGSHRLQLSKPELLTQHADDLADLLQQLDLSDVYLGGLSMGACTAMQYHRLYGFDRVHAYLHIDQSPRVRNAEDWPYGLLGEAQDAEFKRMGALMRLLDPYRDRPYRELPRHLRRELWKSLALFYDAAFYTPHWRSIVKLARHELLIRRLAPVQNWRIYLDCLRSYMEDDYDWRDTLPHIGVPTTVMIGLRSRMYPAAGQLAVHQMIPDARIVEFERCGHSIPFERPGRFVRELGKFLMAA